MAKDEVARGDGKILFKSAFAKNTHIPADLSSICGLDQETGFSWEDTVAWIAQRRFVTCTWEGMDHSDFVNAEIISAKGADGTQRRVLHLVNKQRSPSHAFGGSYIPAPTIRLEYQLRGRSAPDDFQEGFVRYYMKLQENLDEIVPLHVEPGWYMIMDWKESSSGVSGRTGGVNNYRINIGIGKDAGQKRLYWRIMAQQVQPERRTEWVECCRQVTVPLGKWFLVEAYLRKRETEGRLYFAVDRNVVVDQVCRTQHQDNPQPLDFWSIFKHYHSDEWYTMGPTHQWYADVELWTTFPPDVTPF